MDRISSLPDEIICHIGSFVSAKEAAFTTVLSKRWRSLLTIIQDLCYVHDDSVHNNGECFRDFSDRVFALPLTSRVRNFSIDRREFLDIDTAEFDQINRCLCHVLKHGVFDLELRINVEEGHYSLPLEVFTCETVTKLTLGSGFVIDFLPADAYLPALKTLRLDSIRFHQFGRCAFNTLLSASPKLVELIMDGVEFERWKWSFTVSSPTLQRLTICRNWDNCDDFEESISLDTPGLTYLNYSDCVPKEFSFVNISSLAEAVVDLCVGGALNWHETHTKDYDPLNLIYALKKVQILELSIYTMEMIYVFRKVIPVFGNLSCLSVGFAYNFWLSLPILLKKSPNLKTLIIEDPLHDRGSEEEIYVCQYAFSCSVEVLKIKRYGGSVKELEQMKQFLEKLSCLKLVEVHTCAKGKEHVQIMADLLMLPRASPDCKIQVKFS